MAATGFDGAQEDVTVAASNHSEVGAGFKVLAGPHLLGNHELAFDGKSGCRGVRFSYRLGAVNVCVPDPDRSQLASAFIIHQNT